MLIDEDFVKRKHLDVFSSANSAFSFGSFSNDDTLYGVFEPFHSREGMTRRIDHRFFFFLCTNCTAEYQLIKFYSVSFCGHLQDSFSLKVSNLAQKNMKM